MIKSTAFRMSSYSGSCSVSTRRMETVTVTYSAEEQKEMKAIRARYMPEEKKTLTDLEKPGRLMRGWKEKACGLACC